MGYVLAIFKFFLSALRSIKHYVNPISLCILTSLILMLVLPSPPSNRALDFCNCLINSYYPFLTRYRGWVSNHVLLNKNKKNYCNLVNLEVFQNNLIGGKISVTTYYCSCPTMMY